MEHRKSQKPTEIYRDILFSIAIDLQCFSVLNIDFFKKILWNRDSKSAVDDLFGFCSPDARSIRANIQSSSRFFLLRIKIHNPLRTPYDSQQLPFRPFLPADRTLTDGFVHLLRPAQATQEVDHVEDKTEQYKEPNQRPSPRG